MLRFCKPANCFSIRLSNACKSSTKSLQVCAKKGFMLRVEACIYVFPSSLPASASALHLTNNGDPYRKNNSFGNNHLEKVWMRSTLFRISTIFNSG